MTSTGVNMPPSTTYQKKKKNSCKKKISHLADLMPHFVVRHDTQPGKALVVTRQLQLAGEMLIEEVVLEAVEAEQLCAVGHRSA